MGFALSRETEPWLEVTESTPGRKKMTSRTAAAVQYYALLWGALIAAPAMVVAFFGLVLLEACTEVGARAVEFPPKRARRGLGAPAAEGAHGCAPSKASRDGRPGMPG